MPMLDTSKLYGKPGGVVTRGWPTRTKFDGKQEYRCPVCAKHGGDEGYQHLVIFKDGTNYGCAANKMHRDEIWKMCGVGGRGRSVPIIPRKIEQRSTIVAKHQAAIEADLAEKRLLAKITQEGLKSAKVSATLHIDTISNKVQIGTFGTGISCSTNIPPPPLSYNKTDIMGGGYVPPTPKMLSQTSQNWRHRARTDGDVKAYEFDSPDLGVVFDTRLRSWKDDYYAKWCERYHLDGVTTNA